MCSDKRLLIANCDSEPGFNFVSRFIRTSVNKGLIGFSSNCLQCYPDRSFERYVLL